MAENWTRVAVKPPPQGVMVDTISPGGLEQTLQLISGLWFDEHRTMYVYYVPEFWRHISD